MFLDTFLYTAEVDDSFRLLIRLPVMQDLVNGLQREPEVGQGIFRDKTVLGECRREDSEGLEKLFVSSPFVIEGDYDARLAFFSITVFSTIL